jgi:MYXO-CTERM domain-containing protein
MSLFALLSVTALGAPLERGLQAQLYPAGLDFLSNELSELELEVGPMDFSTTVECYDPLTIEDFNVSVVFDSVELTPGDGTLALDVQLGTIQGTYWDVSGTTGWFDTCFDFDVLVELIEVRNARLTGSLEADVSNGELVLNWVTPPSVTGELYSDIDWFPDDLVLSLVQDLVLEELAAALEEQVPPLVRELTLGTLPLGEVAGIPIGIDVDAVRVSASEGLYTAVDVDLGTDGGDGVALDLPLRGGSHFAVGITEELAQDALDLTWATGLLDPDSETTAELIGELIAELDLGADIEAELGVGAAPQVTLGEESARLVLEQTTLEVRSDGEVLLRLVADLEATLDVAIEAEEALMGMSAHDVVLNIRELQADRLLSNEDSDDNLSHFLEGWVAQAASASLRDIPLVANSFGAMGYVMRVDDVSAQQGGLRVWATLFRDDDPEVDLEPPDSEVEVEVASSVVTATFAGTDDRSGQLTYSWRVDGGGWSAWQTDTTATTAAVPGAHTLEVRSRDGWFNVDPTPAIASFDIVGPDDEPASGGCGCASGGAAPAAAGLLVLGLVALRRRPHS